MLGDIPALTSRRRVRTAGESGMMEGGGGAGFSRGGSVDRNNLPIDLFADPATVDRVEELAEGETLSFPWMQGSPDDDTDGASRDKTAPESVAYSIGNLGTTSGKGAVGLSTRLAQIRGASSLEGGAVGGRSQAAIRRIGSRDYVAIGAYLVDGAFTDDAEIIRINFASDAYFDLITLRPEWKAVLAFRGGALLMANAKTAILVVAENGLDELTEDQRSLIKTGFVTVKEKGDPESVEEAPKDDPKKVKTDR
jgi:hypothetical protein